MSVEVRTATPDDAEALARIRVETWRVAYAGLIAEVDGAPAGWAAAGPSRDPELPGHGEVHAIYVLPQFWDAGAGHALMDVMERFLRSAGFTHALLWYLDGNAHAARFYERHGWSEDGAAKSDARLVGGDEANALFERRRQKSL